MQDRGRAAFATRSQVEFSPWGADALRRGDVSHQRAIPTFECSVFESQRLFYSTIIRLTLENISSLPVDFLKLSFDDTTIAVAQQALSSEGELSILEVYETEYDLIHRPVLTWDVGHNHHIPSGKTYGLAVSCFGKVGW